MRQVFLDPVSNRTCELVLPPGGKVHPGQGEPKIGVAHPRCECLADLCIELDAFWCVCCGWNGRVSGAWARDVLERTYPPVPPVTTDQEADDE